MKFASSDKTINILFLDSLREALSIMINETAAKSFIAQLKENISTHSDEIVENSEFISSELEKIFGVGAAKIKDLTLALFFSKIGLKFEKKIASLNDYIQFAKIHGTVPTKAIPSTKLDATDIQIIDELRRDARKPIVQISKNIGVSRPTIINRLKRLIENNIISLNTALNLGELDFKTSLIALEAKNTNSRQELEKMLSVCPRVLMLLRPTDKANMLILIYGEDQNTLKSTIETFRGINDINLVSVYNSDPPLFNESFCLNVFPIKGDVTPCGMKCDDCLHFQEDQCIGCPAVTSYKGLL